MIDLEAEPPVPGPAARWPADRGGWWWHMVAQIVM